MVRAGLPILQVLAMLRDQLEGPAIKEVVEDMISDQEMKDAKIKFPIKTPTTKEEYYYRSLFSNHFPSNTAAMSVPQEPSVACSTKIALEWDEAFKLINEPLSLIHI